ncbi:DUF5689 domain-containing protein [Flavicella sediminum]|uniref:DUF5689 domain-containing protein n=1 Tax=Flavicella sediminum TaxID=2585141 RepID=UPI00111E7003|nr:DUF5689 domain-containing protein [Flavicella sediminum]
MKKILLKISVILSLCACVNDSKFSTPEIFCDEIDLVETHTLSQIKEMSGFGLVVFSEELIISGYVISSDASGNIYKNLYLQDAFENPTSAIKISLDETNSNAKFPIGNKVFVKLKGLALGYAYGSLAIGKANGATLENIPNLLLDQHIFRTCETKEIVPKKIAISELETEDVGLFVELENVQFQQVGAKETYANVDNTKAVDRIIEQLHTTCEINSEIILHTSGFSKFKNEEIPRGKGTISGILDTYYSEFQLLLNTSKDVHLNEERCSWAATFGTPISMVALQNLYQGEVVEFGMQNYRMEGFVISSDENGNFKEKLFIQDKKENPTGGVQILLEQENYFEEFQFGEKISISLQNLYMDKIDGVLTIGFYKKNSVAEIAETEINQFIQQTDSVFKITPLESELENLNANSANAVLVKVNQVQLVAQEKEKAFAYFSGSESANRILESCHVSQKLTVFTEGEAVFSNRKFPVGNGSIVGVFTNTSEKLKLQINSSTAIQFDNPYEACPVLVPKILITEVADPENATGARFVELYNAGTNVIDLTGWKLNKYINGATSVSGDGLLLSGILNPQEFWIVSNVDFETLFGFSSDKVSNYISANGDDVYELLDASGKRHDIFGEIGTDATGTNWEFEDGRAVRLKTMTTPSPNFSDSEWQISSKANHQKKQAPQDFNPGVW